MNKLYKEENKKDPCININYMCTIVTEMLVQTVLRVSTTAHYKNNSTVFMGMVKSVSLWAKWPASLVLIPGSVVCQATIGVFLLPPWWDASQSQGLAPNIKYMAGERHSTVRVKCHPEERNTLCPQGSNLDYLI